MSLTAEILRRIVTRSTRVENGRTIMIRRTSRTRRRMSRVASGSMRANCAANRRQSSMHAPVRCGSAHRGDVTTVLYATNRTRTSLASHVVLYVMYAPTATTRPGTRITISSRDHDGTIDRECSATLSVRISADQRPFNRTPALPGATMNNGSPAFALRRNRGRERPAVRDDRADLLAQRRRGWAMRRVKSDRRRPRFRYPCNGELPGGTTSGREALCRG